MAVGTWLLGESKIRPGTYFRVESNDIQTVGAVNGIVACLFGGNWGKLNTVTDIDISQMNNLRGIFGTGNGVDAIKEAFLGGAKVVKAIRVGQTNGVVCSAWIYSPSTTVNLKLARTVPSDGLVDILVGRFADVVQNYTFAITTTDWKYTFVAETEYKVQSTLSADGKTYTNLKVQFTAAGLAKLAAKAPGGKVYVYKKYESRDKAVRLWSDFPSDRNFTMTFKTDLTSGKRQFIVYDETGSVFDKVEFPRGGNEAKKLVDALTNRDLSTRRFHGRCDGEGLLEDFTNRKITPGTNPTVNVASFSDGLDILERYYWNTLIIDRNSATVKTLMTEYVKQSYETGHLGMAVVPGFPSSQTWSERFAEAKAINDWRVVYVPSGWTNIDGTTSTGWKAAARIAGMIAGCETNTSLTHATISNALSLTEPLSNGDIIKGIESGCLMLSLNDDDQVQIDSAINTLVTLGTNYDAGWKKIRRTKTRFELMTRINRTCDRLIGKLNNDVDGQATLIAAMQGIINEMIAEHKLFFGSKVELDSRYKPVGDKCWFLLTIADVDSLEQIYLTYNFRYGNFD